MKKLISATLASIGLLATNAFANDFHCSFQDIINSNDKIVFPIYTAKVNYIFYKNNTDAHAIVTWEYNFDKTRECKDMASELYPKQNLIVPNLATPKVQVKVLGSDEYFHIQADPLPNNQWVGFTGMIPIKQSSKQLIIDTIKRNKKVADFKTDNFLIITKYEPVPVGLFNCTENEESASPENFAKNLKKLKKVTEIVSSSGVKLSEAKRAFKENCLKITNVSATSFTELVKKQTKSSKILKKSFSLIGYEPRESKLEYNELPSELATLSEH